MHLLGGKVFLNWRMNPNDRAYNYASMADGYRLAVKRLFESLSVDNTLHDADAVIFPILFCAHQCAELYLKAIIIEISEIKGDNPWATEIKNTHRLDKLIDAANQCLDDINRLVRNPEAEPLYKMLDLFESLGVADGYYHPDFARYPESAPNSNHLQIEYPFVTNDSFVYDIQELADLLNNGCAFLDGWYTLFNSGLDITRTSGANYATR